MHTIMGRRWLGLTLYQARFVAETDDIVQPDWACTSTERGCIGWQCHLTRKQKVFSLNFIKAPNSFTVFQDASLMPKTVHYVHKFSILTSKIVKTAFLFLLTERVHDPHLENS